MERNPFDNRNYDEKQSYADVERERYLLKLRAKGDRRERGRELRGQALALGADYAAMTSEKHLGAIARQTEFRAHVRRNWLDSRKNQEVMLRKLGQIYRERLVWFVGRSLEAAAQVRGEFDKTTGVNRQLGPAREAKHE